MDQKVTSLKGESTNNLINMIKSFFSWKHEYVKNNDSSLLVYCSTAKESSCCQKL